MIWFFIAGFISGVVGTLKFSTYWVKKHNKYTQHVFERSMKAQQREREITGGDYHD